jgi:hypothetical protein
MKSHLLKCSQKNKNHEMEKQLTTALQEREWKCMWSSCSSGHIDNAEKAATHMSNHITADTVYCQWGSCTFKASTLADLHAHVAVSHQVYSHMTIPTRAKFCIECGVWLLSDLEWTKHSAQHAKTPDIIYGPITAEGILAAPRRCLYCITRGRFVQMENAGHYAEHIEEHINNHVDNDSGQGVQCPHHSCPARDFSKKELRDHFATGHGIVL